MLDSKSIYLYSSRTYGIRKVDVFCAISTEPQVSLYRTQVQGWNSILFQRTDLYSY